MARYGDVYYDVFAHVFVGDVDPTGKILIPAQFDPLVPDQLRYINSQVVDVTGYTQFFIDSNGLKHGVHTDSTWQALNCSWNTLIVFDKQQNVWRVRDYRDDLTVYSMQVRYSKENAGKFVDIGGGVTILVDTSDRGSRLINGAVLLAQSDASVLVDWKTKDGLFVQLNQQQTLTVGDAVTRHIEACFSVEKQVAADIASGAITTNDQIDQAYNAIPSAARTPVATTQQFP